MTFYKKSVGRPTHEELMIIEKIEKIILEKGIPLDAVPECTNLNELIEAKIYLDNYSIESAINEDEPIHEIEQELIEEIQDNDTLDESDTFENDESKIVEKSVFEQETDFSKPQFIADNYNPFEDPIIERSYSQAQAQETSQQLDSDEEELVLDEAKNPALADLPDHTKRRAAEQTANTLLKGYAQIVPAPFKWFAKMPEQKIEKMAFDGEIDLSIEVSDGVTFEDYMRQSNEQIDEIFEVDEDTLADIREPLIEVLMEQNLELTPAQRLMAAIFSHLAQMFTVALKLRNQNNRILSYQKHLTHLYSNKGEMAA